MILCCVIVCLGIYGLHLLGAATEMMQSLHDDRVIPIEQLSSMRYGYVKGILVTAEQYENHVLTGPQALSMIDRAATHIDSEWSAYLHTYLLPEEDSIAGRMKAEKLLADSAIYRLRYQIATARDREQTERANQDAYAAILPVLTAINELINIQIAVSGALERDSKQTLRATRRNFIWIVAIVLILALLLSLWIVRDSQVLVARLRQSMHLVAASESKYRTFLDHAGDGILMADLSLTVIDSNHSASDILGYPRGELPGCKVDQLLPDSEPDRLIQALQAAAGPLVYTLNIARPGGTGMAVEVSITPVPAIGYMIILRDITERLRAGERQSLLAAIIDHSDDAIISKTLAGIITTWNHGAENLFGYTAAEAIGRHISLLFPEDRLAEEDMIIYRISQGQTVSHYETQRLTRSGALLDISLTVSPIRDATGRIIGASKIARDITAKKAAARSLQQSEEQYRYLFDHNPACIIIWDPTTLTVVEVNEAVIEKYGYTREEWTGMSVLSYRAAVDHDRVRSFARYMLDQGGKVQRGLWHHIKKNGEVMQMEIASHLMLYQGRQCILSLGRDVTQEKRAQQALVESEYKFRTLVESAGDAIVMIDPYFARMLDVNMATTVLLGYTREELLAMELRDVFFANELEHSPLRYGELGEGQTSMMTERRLRHKDGHAVETEITSAPLEGYGYISVVRDVTERKRTQRILQALLDHTPENIVLLNKDYRIICYNEAMRRTLRLYFHRDMELMDDYRHYVIPDHQEVFLQSFDTAIAGGSVQIELETRGDEFSIWFEYQMHPVYSKDGELMGASLSARDITTRKIAEEKLQALNESLEQKVADRTAELQAANKALEAFSYSVSHDLKAPVRAIIGFTDIIAQDYAPRLDADLREMFRYINDSARRMSAIIDDLLTLARYERMSLSPQVIDMEQLIRSVWDSISFSTRHHATLQLQPVPEIVADPSLIQQVLVNLLSNAVKYSSKKEAPMVTVWAERSPTHITYIVRDNGAGFDMKNYNRLFGAFQRLHGMNDFDGTGVGLLLVKRIIEKHGGQVWAEAKVGEGATFYFTLPAA